MVSPFYIGYRPGDPAGRYPGGGISGGGYRFRPSDVNPEEFYNVFEVIDGAVEGAGKQAEGVYRAPVDFIEYWKKDFKSAFAVTGGFAGQSALDFGSMTASQRAIYAEEDMLPGAADIKISLWVPDYIRDPKGMMWKQVKGIAQNTFSGEDLERRAKQAFIKNLTRGEEGRGGVLDHWARTAFARHTFRETTDAVPASASTPADFLALEGDKSFKNRIYKKAKVRTLVSGEAESEVKDVYSAVAGELDSFYLTSDSASKRRTGYIKVMNASQEAMAQELRYMSEGRAGWGGRSFDDLKDSIVAGAAAGPGVASSIRNNVDFAVNDFIKKSEFMDAINATSKGLNAPGAGLRTNLDKVFVQWHEIDPLSGVVKGKTDKLGGQLKSFGDNLSKTYEQLDEMRTFYASQGAAYSQIADEFDTMVEGLETWLGDLGKGHRTDIYKNAGWENIVNKLNATDPKDVREGMRELYALKEDVERFNRRIGGVDMFETGFQHKFLSRMLEGSVLNPKSGADLGAYLGDLDLQGAPRTAAWLHRTMTERIRKDADDLARITTSEKFINTFLFGNRLRNRGIIWTPRQLVESYLQGVHYFGFKIDPFTIHLKPEEVPTLYRPFHSFVQKRAGWDPSTGIATGALAYVFNLNYKDGTLKNVHGGEHFAFAMSVQRKLDLMERNGTLNDFVSSLGLTGTLNARFGPTMPMKHKVLLAMLNVDGEGDWADMFGDVFEFDMLSTIANKPKSAKDYYQNLQAFREHFLKAHPDLAKYLDPSGSAKIMGEDGAEAIWGILSQLNFMQDSPDFISPLRAAAGYIEKLTERLNKIQTLLQNVPIVKKVVSAYTLAKTAIAEVVADAVVALLEGGSGGMATPVAGVVRQVVRKVVITIEDQVVDRVKNILKAIFKADFSGIGRDFEGMIVSFLKSCFVVTAIFSVFIFIMSFFTGMLFGTFPPVSERSVGAGGVGGLTGGQLPPGGAFGSGSGCSAGTHPTGTTGYPCFHWDGHRASDLFGPEGSPVVAPFDGTAYPADFTLGGHTVIIHPDDSCHAGVYIAHLREEGRPSWGTKVSEGEVIGLLSDSGSAAGAPHVHLAFNTFADFNTQVLDVCTIQVLEDWGNSCNQAYRDSSGYLEPNSPHFPSGQISFCCNGARSDRSGCYPAANQR